MVSIGFSKANTLLSRIANLFNKKRFRHCWIRYYNEYTGLDMIIDSSITGVFEVPHCTALRKWKGVVELAPHDYLNADHWLIKLGCITKSYYDLSPWYYRMFKRAYHWITFKLSNFSKDPSNDVYIDNVYRLLTAIDERFHDIDINEENPQKLYERLLEMGWCDIKLHESTTKGSNGHT